MNRNEGAVCSGQAVMADSGLDTLVQPGDPDGGPSYAETLKFKYNDVATTVKPVFFNEYDLFAVPPNKVPREKWIFHDEIYKAIGKTISAERVGGLQRVHGMWRIYCDNVSDRATLMTHGIALRGKSISLTILNPQRLEVITPDSMRVRIKDVPLSADDGQIDRALTLKGCAIVGKITREKLRIDGRLTNCDTGDRLAIIKVPSEPLPRMMVIGRYRARVFHFGQNKETCVKCLEEGHGIRRCTNDWKCRLCKESGHKQDRCPISLDRGHDDEDKVREESPWRAPSPAPSIHSPLSSRATSDNESDYSADTVMSTHESDKSDQQADQRRASSTDDQPSLPVTGKQRTKKQKKKDKKRNQRGSQCTLASFLSQAAAATRDADSQSDIEAPTRKEKRNRVPSDGAHSQRETKKFKEKGF